MRISPRPKLLTLTQLCAALDVAPARAWRLYRRGTVRPDFVANNAILFLPSTASELAARISFLESAATHS
jgi:hypothetical protein